jgi:hypothetical protein
MCRSNPRQKQSGWGLTFVDFGACPLAHSEFSFQRNWGEHISEREVLMLRDFDVPIFKYGSPSSGLLVPPNLSLRALGPVQANPRRGISRNVRHCHASSWLALKTLYACRLPMIESQTSPHLIQNEEAARRIKLLDEFLLCREYVDELFGPRHLASYTQMSSLGACGSARRLNPRDR